MRLFVGVALPAELAGGLRAKLNRFRPLAPLRWSKVENLHITTKFIGAWPEEKLEEMRAALRPVAACAPFEIEMRGLGWFPNPHQPRIFWIGIRGGEALHALAAATEAASAGLGIASEDRPYRPHLTLARIDNRGAKADLTALRRAVALEPDESARFTCGAFHLYLSEPGAGGSVYTKLATFPLEGVR